MRLFLQNLEWQLIEFAKNWERNNVFWFLAEIKRQWEAVGATGHHARERRMTDFWTKSREPQKRVCRKRPRRWCLLNIPPKVLERLIRQQPDTRKWKWFHGD